MTRLFYLFLILIPWCFLKANSEVLDSKEAKENLPKSREKRHIFLLCMNFPDCCDIKGKDMCGFACPVCPVKTDFCKQFYLTELSVLLLQKFRQINYFIILQQSQCGKLR